MRKLTKYEKILTDLVAMSNVFLYVYVIQESDEETTPPAPAPKTEMLESPSLAQTSPHHSVSQHVYTKPKPTDSAKPGLFVYMSFDASFNIFV